MTQQNCNYIHPAACAVCPLPVHSPTERERELCCQFNQCRLRAQCIMYYFQHDVTIGQKCNYHSNTIIFRDLGCCEIRCGKSTNCDKLTNCSDLYGFTSFTISKTITTLSKSDDELDMSSLSRLRQCICKNVYSKKLKFHVINVL